MPPTKSPSPPSSDAAADSPPSGKPSSARCASMCRLRERAWMLFWLPIIGHGDEPENYSPIKLEVRNPKLETNSNVQKSEKQIGRASAVAASVSRHSEV